MEFLIWSWWIQYGREGFNDHLLYSSFELTIGHSSIPRFRREGWEWLACLKDNRGDVVTPCRLGNGFGLRYIDRIIKGEYNSIDAGTAQDKDDGISDMDIVVLECCE